MIQAFITTRKKRKATPIAQIVSLHNGCIFPLRLFSVKRYTVFYASQQGVSVISFELV